QEVEKDVRARTEGDLGSAKTLCAPFDQPDLVEGTVCFASGKPAKTWSFWGRSY
uniref:Proline-tRNA ligase class II C-terminal domain-containing protein n=1 Tax=Aegilops tauschii subsp. strangulata TaxID=200361 RepID=A0A453R9X7_AEGTS